MKNIVKDYVKRLTEEDLKFLNIRLTQRLGGDVGEAVAFMQSDLDIDKWFASASSADDFFEMVDQVDLCLQQELKRRVPYEQAKQKA